MTSQGYWWQVGSTGDELERLKLIDTWVCERLLSDRTLTDFWNPEAWKTLNLEVKARFDLNLGAENWQLRWIHCIDQGYELLVGLPSPGHLFLPTIDLDMDSLATQREKACQRFMAYRVLYHQKMQGQLLVARTIQFLPNYPLLNNFGSLRSGIQDEEMTISNYLGDVRDDEADDEDDERGGDELMQS